MESKKLANKLKVDGIASKNLDTDKIEAEINITYTKDTPNFDMSITVNLDKDPELKVSVEKQW